MKPTEPMDLPDINVLIALFEPQHIHHSAAIDWFIGTKLSGWSTCPLTENGFVRIVSGPGYANLHLSPIQVADGLRILTTSTSNNHTFWADDVSLLDTSLFDLADVRGHRQLTDLYLLGLCQKHNATFVTLDGAVQSLTRAIKASHPDLVRVLIPH